MTRDEVIKRYGIDPGKFMTWDIVDQLLEEEIKVGAQISDLCVQTRDVIQLTTEINMTNFRGQTIDKYGVKYYYFLPLWR